VLLGGHIKPRDCYKRDKGVARFNGKDSLHTNVLRKIDPAALNRNPFVDSDDAKDFGSAPVQADWKVYQVTGQTGTVTARTFSLQPLHQQIVCNLDAYDRTISGGVQFETGEKHKKKHEYYYIFPHDTMFAADVDAPNITQAEFYTAIQEFILSFKHATRSLGFTEPEQQRIADWMGVYESNALPAPCPYKRTKRSVHIHCHVFGPVAHRFEDFAAFLTDNVLPSVSPQFRTLFDVSIYSNGRAFRALGQSKLPAPGCPEKMLHPEPLATLSGKSILAVWKFGKKK
jgi:hypothetical protein